jgi:phage tail sheath protein FI
VANRALLDVTGVTRDTPTAEQNLLLQAQLNPVLAQAHGIVIGGEDTLCTDDLAWRPVHVRRLMCLLRRAAIKRGAQYVFEPNGPALRRTVERAFESLLDTLHQRGAFAGRSAREAFEVVVDEELNTPGSVDAGRLCIELKFAPAQAMRFLVIRLVRHGEQLQALEGRG